MSGIPPIKIRGVRSPIPQGYMLGRVDPGTGDVQLIPIPVLAHHLVKSGRMAQTPISGGTTDAAKAAKDAKKALQLAGLAATLDAGGGGGDGDMGPPGPAGAAGAPGGGGGGSGLNSANKALELAAIGTILDFTDAPFDLPPGHNSLKTTNGLVFSFDGNGASPPANSTCDIYVPFACTIIAATTLSDVSGSCILDVWVKAFSTSSPPTVANTITAAALPTLSAATGANDTTLTGWTVSVPAGSMIRVNVNSASTLTRIVLTLTIKK